MMEQDKRDRAIEELRKESLSGGYAVSFSVNGTSMKYLFREGDEVAVRKTAPGDIRRGDIVVWRPSQFAFGQPVIHRVIRRKKTRDGMRFLTKGDFNLLPDPGWAVADDIVGKVTSVKRAGRETGIEKGWGRLRSLALCLCSALAVYSAGAAAAILHAGKALLPEQEPSGGDPALMLRASGAGVSPEEWSASVDGCDGPEAAVAGGRPVEILDFGPGGFSEEAMRLLRRGARVTHVDPLSDAGSLPCGAGHVIAARYINLLPQKERRIKVYRRAHECLVPGGTVVLSWINPGRRSAGMLRPMLRRFWSAVLGKAYRGPAAYDLVAGGMVMRCRLQAAAVRKEIAEAGRFSIRSCRETGDCIRIVAVKG